MTDPFQNIPVVKRRSSVFDDVTTGHSSQNDDPFATLPTSRAPAGQRGIVAGLGDVATAIRHPIETVRGMGNAIAEGFNTVSSPVEGMPKNILGNLIHGRPQERVTKANTPNAVTPREFGKGAFDSAVNIGFALAPELALPIRAGVNAGLGALNSPDDRLRGATAGLALGEVLHGATKLPGKLGRIGDVSGGMMDEGVQGLKEVGQEQSLWSANRRPGYTPSPSGHTASYRTSATAQAGTVRRARYCRGSTTKTSRRASAQRRNVHLARIG